MELNRSEVCQEAKVEQERVAREVAFFLRTVVEDSDAFNVLLAVYFFQFVESLEINCRFFDLANRVFMSLESVGAVNLQYGGRRWG